MPAGGVDGASLRAAAAVASRPLRILLVEDHADSATALSTLLETFGHAVTVASSVQEALAQPSPFDLVMSDIGLPDGDGFQLMEALRRTKPKPVRGIALSGFGSEQDARRSREAGFAEHLTKPVDLDRLLAAIAHVASGAAA
jgi:CheY-like chemotaxis protein